MDQKEGSVNLSVTYPVVVVVVVVVVVAPAAPSMGTVKERYDESSMGIITFVSFLYPSLVDPLLRQK